MKHEQDKRWLYRKSSAPVLWKIQIGILVLLLIPEFFIHHHGYFAELGIHLDSSFGFYAWSGFLAIVGFVVLARIVGAVLQRKGSYYDE